MSATLNIGRLRTLVRLAGALLCAAAASLRASPQEGSRESHASPGRELFETRCAACHGREGKGDGEAASLLSPRPRDFTSGVYKFRSTEPGSLPTDEDIAASIQNGLHGTSMPGWNEFLTGDSLAAVVDVVKSFSPRFNSEKPRPVRTGAAVPVSPASAAAGKSVYEKLECSGCHGTDGEGKDAVAADLADDWGHPTAATNLREPWTFRGGPTPADIFMRLRAGIDGTPMPSYLGAASERDLRNLANYVHSLGRAPVWEMDASELQRHYAEREKRDLADPVARGAYLIATTGCVECHTPLREDGSIVEEMKFAGGQHWEIGPYGTMVSANLTSDKETGLGGWTDEQIRTFLTKGIRRDGSRMLPFPMSWPAWANLRDSDIRAIIAYLRSIPAISNSIPPPKPRDIFSYLWEKFKMLILKEDFSLDLYPGNAGTPRGAASGVESAGTKAGTARADGGPAPGPGAEGVRQ